MKKTYKREVAVGLIVFVIYLALAGDVKVLEVVTGPFMLFAMAAFGFDSWAKQVSRHPRRYDHDSDGMGEMGSDSTDRSDTDRGGYSDSELRRK